MHGRTFNHHKNSMFMLCKHVKESQSHEFFHILYVFWSRIRMRKFSALAIQSEITQNFLFLSRSSIFRWNLPYPPYNSHIISYTHSYLYCTWNDHNKFFFVRVFFLFLFLIPPKKFRWHCIVYESKFKLRMNENWLIVCENASSCLFRNSVQRKKNFCFWEFKF